MPKPDPIIVGLMQDYDKLPDNPVEGMMAYLPGVDVMVVFANGVWKQVTNRLSWRLFLDDLRPPLAVGWQGSDIEIARTVIEAQRLVEKNGLPTEISFDNDLGNAEGGDADVFMWWLINGHLDGKFNCAQINLVQVHSANSVRAPYLLQLWEGFCRSQEITCNVRKAVALER